ncbi:HK97-gp10 family putative phage morphogenesis protein [Proteiniborus sp. MB09-C3]|uniref:HK97-gp10 family putative phage morphogenesis protein n=1 Tax=Proteiniborus sp. MB09-C3 TaxID=3050072 RepID=UPI00255512A9|nr:HK97-gp10 family putative phage morphogenesis protein [Proteiniborus sp. MB09-C3]WIV13938.1 HK97 gp10 family phage protein [Proteiniborus sp. MB09-C3]
MAGIELDGFDEFIEFIDDIAISESDEKKAMKKVVEMVGQEVESNTPEDTGKTKRNVKRQVKRELHATIGIVKLGTWYSVFTEFGTSKSKKHVGFFDRSIRNKQDEAFKILEDELLNVK